MKEEQRATQRWLGTKSEPRTGYYEYKNVRFKLSRSSRLSQGWNFQAFGREPQEYPTWEGAVVALEETCTEIANHRAARRNK